MEMCLQNTACFFWSKLLKMLYIIIYKNVQCLCFPILLGIKVVALNRKLLVKCELLF